MPRRFINPDRLTPDGSPGLGLGELMADELRSRRDFGQPVIEEERFKTGLISVSVLWDKWDHVPHAVRTKAILHAYQMAESSEFAEKITLAGGLTYPEAYASGMLPFQIFPAWRSIDPISHEQCREAMVIEGASLLIDPARPQLRFATEEEAEGCLRRLVQRLPGSEPIWQILREVGRELELSWDT